MILDVFVPVLLPLVLVAGAAYLLGRLANLDPRTPGRAAFYLFNPSLVFVALANSEIPLEMLGRLVLLRVLTLLLLVPLAQVLTGKLRLAAPVASAFILAVGFPNSGNFGLSITEYAFGQSGVALAVICFVADNLLVNSLGVYFAARGNAGVRDAVREVLRNPALYAVALGILAGQLHWVAPIWLSRALDLLSRAAVPTLLMVLGMQLAFLPLERRHLRLIGLISVLRLVVAPLIAWALAMPLGLMGLVRNVGVLETAMPSAVTPSIIANRYDSEPTLVAGAILVSSIISLITLTLLLTWIT
jgi:malate permease and related proteins